MTRKEGLVPKISNGSFRYLMENDGYYVDKTSVIKTLFSKESQQVQLITRPRRFGKSLTLSMLYSFFTCVVDGKEVKGDTSWNRRLFSGLKITEDETFCREHMGQYPVIYLNFKDIGSPDFKTAYKNLCDAIVEVAGDFSEAVDVSKLSRVHRNAFMNLQNPAYLYRPGNRNLVEQSLELLTKILNAAFG